MQLVAKMSSETTPPYLLQITPMLATTHPEDGGIKFLRNASTLPPPNYTYACHDHPEDGGIKFLRNASTLPPPNYTYACHDSS
jgi:hypothetical protein